MEDGSGTAWRRSVEDTGRLGDNAEEVGRGWRGTLMRWRQGRRGMAWRRSMAADTSSGMAPGLVDDGAGLLDGGRQHEGSGTAADNCGARTCI
uniref:DUF834 domain-containing protein n=1 Tax=Oryza glumipatula TaxID=40148 RepID=A0A0E0BS83_9ORYZ